MTTSLRFWVEKCENCAEAMFFRHPFNKNVTLNEEIIINCRSAYSEINYEVTQGHPPVQVKYPCISLKLLLQLL